MNKSQRNHKKKAYTLHLKFEPGWIVSNLHTRSYSLITLPLFSSSLLFAYKWNDSMSNYIDWHIIIIIVMLLLCNIPLYAYAFWEKGGWSCGFGCMRIFMFMYILSIYSPLFDSGMMWCGVMWCDVIWWLFLFTFGFWIVVCTSRVWKLWEMGIAFWY